MCSMYGGHGHIGIFILRWLLGIVILLIVFWMGLQIGEFRGYIGRAGYGMTPRYQMMGSGQGGMPMIPATGTGAP